MAPAASHASLHNTRPVGLGLSGFQTAAVLLAGMIKGHHGLTMIGPNVEALFLLPTLLHRIQTPLNGTSLANRLTTDLNEDRIGVRTRQDS